MKIAAFDLSLTAPGFAKYDGKARSGGVINTKKLSGMERLDHIRREVLALSEGMDLVVIEDYAYGMANQAHQLGELGGIIRYSLWERGILYVTVNPVYLKQYLMGAGNAKKDAMIAEAVRRLGYDGHSNDGADALTLLHAGLDAYGQGWAKLPAAQVERLQQVPWPPLPGRRWDTVGAVPKKPKTRKKVAA
jgi:crossover junction endodeoxyribonuclease RuvC